MTGGGADCVIRLTHHHPQPGLARTRVCLGISAGLEDRGPYIEDTKHIERYRLLDHVDNDRVRGVTLPDPANGDIKQATTLSLPGYQKGSHSPTRSNPLLVHVLSGLATTLGHCRPLTSQSRSQYLRLCRTSQARSHSGRVPIAIPSSRW